MIEDEINKIIENIKQQIEDAIQSLIQALLQSIIDALNQFFMQLCGIPCISAFIPLGALVFGTYFRNRRYNPLS